VNSFSPLTGGCEKVSYKLAEYLSDYYEVSVITRRYPGRNHANFTKFKVLEYLPNDQAVFLNGLKNIHPDIVLIYSDLFDFFRQIILSEVNYKLVIAPCGANFLYTNKSMASYLYKSSHKIDGIICHSKYDRDYKFFNSERFQDRLEVIPNGVDLAEFDENTLSREEIANSLKMNSDKVSQKWILNVSNFFPGKGQEHLANILKRLPSDDFLYIQVCSKMSFDVGESLEIRWKQRISHSSVSFLLAKNISRETVIGLFKNSNVFAFPSEKEVAPLVLLECMAARLPWVSTDVGNSRGLKGGSCITAAKDTRFYNVFDERVNSIFAQEIQNNWESPAVGEEGRYQIESSMTWNKIMPQYHSLIERMYAKD